MLAKFEKDMATATGWLAALALIADAKEPVHGYRIAKTLEEEAPKGMALKPGTLYPVLRQMKAEGLLESELAESPEGPPRKCFTVTEAGRDLLARAAARWHEAGAWMDENLGGQDDTDNH